VFTRKSNSSQTFRIRDFEKLGANEFEFLNNSHVAAQRGDMQNGIAICVADFFEISFFVTEKCFCLANFDAVEKGDHVHVQRPKMKELIGFSKIIMKRSEAVHHFFPSLRLTISSQFKLDNKFDVLLHVGHGSQIRVRLNFGKYNIPAA
jgi:hypothetical protein